MPQQSRGTCQFCGKETTKGALTRHLRSCPARAVATAAADAGKGKPETLYHLVARAADTPDFWLHLEMRGSAYLGDLDEYLRAIWLECCGHLSQFSFGGWRGRPIAMGRKLDQVATQLAEEPLVHIYDFGTESVTEIVLVESRMGKPLTKHSIVLMARNSTPLWLCQECGERADFLCLECLYEQERSGLLCAAHAAGHPHDEPLALVNSPRIGLCGYDGPALPPY